MDVSPALLKMCLHKRTYLSRADAKRAARHTAKSKGSRKHRMDIYECSHCGFFHVTSKGKDRNRSACI
jgi:hypothetical protein